jgi:hypothetical protein
MERVPPQGSGFVGFNLIPAEHHGLDAGQGGVPGGGQVDMHDDEAGKGPGNQGMRRAQERQPAQADRSAGPALCAPHQRSGHDLQRQQHIEYCEVSSLLQRIHLLLGDFSKGGLHRGRCRAGRTVPAGQPGRRSLPAGG